MYEKYRDDPVGFIKDILREEITDDIKEVCIAIRDNTIVQVPSANGTGKTHGAARIIVWAYKCHPGAQIYTAAAPPEDNLRRLLWGEISSIVEKNPALFLQDHVKLGSMEITRSALERCVGVTIPQTGDPSTRKARFSGKHAPYLLFVLDEADAIPEEIFEAIQSCMSGGEARLLCLFNPRMRTGPLWTRESRREAKIVRLSAFTHPNVVVGSKTVDGKEINIIPGAVTREITCQRISAWSRPLMPGENALEGDTFVVPDFLVGYRPKKNDEGEFYPAIQAGIRKVTEPAFCYMVLGRYSSQSENQLISREWCEAAVERRKAYVALFGEVPPVPCRPWLGLDVAEFGKDLNVVTLRYMDFVADQILWQGVDIGVSSKKGTDVYKVNDCEIGFIDANGIGAGVWPIMREKGCQVVRVMVQEKPTEIALTDNAVMGQFDMIRDQGWWAMREWIRTSRKAMLPLNSLVPGGLVDQMTAPTYSKTLTGRIKVCSNDIIRTRLRGASPDHATSLMLTFCPQISEEESSEVLSQKYA